MKVTAVGNETPVSNPLELQSGISQESSVGYNEWIYYQIVSSDSDQEIQVELTNLSADLDLYVRKIPCPLYSIMTAGLMSGQFPEYA